MVSTVLLDTPQNEDIVSPTSSQVLMLPVDSPISPDMLNAGPRTLKFAHYPVADIKVSNL